MPHFLKLKNIWNKVSFKKWQYIQLMVFHKCKILTTFLLHCLVKKKKIKHLKNTGRHQFSE